ncbi:C_GCAxxG_C_C family protein [bacterium]|nr:C_GCAxxG_C_C family protein [bacterium]
MKDKAVEYFNNGYSCSESIIKAASEAGLCDKSLISIATSFSGGMSSGCLCGAVAAVQMISGLHFGKDNSYGNEVCARQKAAFIVEEFKKRNKVTCCRVLSGGLSGAEKKERCSKYVADCCEILEEALKVKV